MRISRLTGHRRAFTWLLVGGAVAVSACTIPSPFLWDRAEAAKQPCQLADFMDEQLCRPDLPVNEVVSIERRQRGLGDCSVLLADQKALHLDWTERGTISSVFCPWRPGKTRTKQGCESLWLKIYPGCRGTLPSPMPGSIGPYEQTWLDRLPLGSQTIVPETPPSSPPASPSPDR